MGQITFFSSAWKQHDGCPYAYLSDKAVTVSKTLFTFVFSSTSCINNKYFTMEIIISQIILLASFGTSSQQDVRNIYSQFEFLWTVPVQVWYTGSWFMKLVVSEACIWPITFVRRIVRSRSPFFNLLFWLTAYSCVQFNLLFWLTVYSCVQFVSCYLHWSPFSQSAVCIKAIWPFCSC